MTGSSIIETVEPKTTLTRVYDISLTSIAPSRKEPSFNQSPYTEGPTN